MHNLTSIIALAASLCAAMPHSMEFPPITLDIHPTSSHAIISNSHTAISSFSNQTTSYTLSIHPTFRPAANVNISSSALGACGPGIGACSAGLCCSGYGYCGSNSSYCGTNCQSSFGICNLNSTIPFYTLSYQPLSTSAFTTSNDNTGAAGIVTDDPASSTTVGISYAPETTSTEDVPTITLPSVVGISYEPISTTDTAV